MRGPSTQPNGVGSTPNKSIVPWRNLTWLSALGSIAPIEIVDYAVIAERDRCLPLGPPFQPAGQLAQNLGTHLRANVP